MLEGEACRILAWLKCDRFATAVRYRYPASERRMSCPLASQVSYSEDLRGCLAGQRDRGMIADIARKLSFLQLLDAWQSVARNRGALSHSLYVRLSLGVSACRLRHSSHQAWSERIRHRCPHDCYRNATQLGATWWDCCREPPTGELMSETNGDGQEPEDMATTEFQDRCLKPLGHPSRICAKGREPSRQS